MLARYNALLYIKIFLIPKQKYTQEKAYPNHTDK